MDQLPTIAVCKVAFTPDYTENSYLAICRAMKSEPPNLHMRSRRRSSR
jgi:hypothetical protein